METHDNVSGKFLENLFHFASGKCFSLFYHKRVRSFQWKINLLGFKSLERKEKKKEKKKAHVFNVQSVHRPLLCAVNAHFVRIQSLVLISIWKHSLRLLQIKTISTNIIVYLFVQLRTSKMLRFFFLKFNKGMEPCNLTTDICFGFDFNSTTKFILII